MKRRIGELLVAAGACTDADVRAALDHQRGAGKGQRLGELLIGRGKATPAAVARALSLQFDLPFVALPYRPPDAKWLPLEFQREKRVVAFRHEVDGKAERLHVAVADPSNLELIDELQFELRKPVRIHVAASDDLDRALEALGDEGAEELPTIELGQESEAAPEAEGDAFTATIDDSWAEHAPGGSGTAPRGGAPGRPSISPPPFGELGAAASSAPPAREPEPGSRAASAPVAAAPRASSDAAGARASPTSTSPPTGSVLDPSSPSATSAPSKAGVNVPPREAKAPAREGLDFSDDDLRILEDLEILTQAGSTKAAGDKLRPAEILVGLIRLLIKKGIIREEEFLDELMGK